MTEILRCTPMRAAETLAPPAFAMPPGACDSHFHVFEPGYRPVPAPLYTFPDGTLGQYLARAEAIQRMAARATPRGWHLQFYAPGTIVRDLLPFFGDYQDTFVIDHMGLMTESDPEFGRRLHALLGQGRCWIKLSGPYRVAKDGPLSHVAPLARSLVATRPDRLLWGSDWPHLPDGQRDTGEILNLLPDWAPDEADRRTILVDGPGRLFFA